MSEDEVGRKRPNEFTDADIGSLVDDVVAKKPSGKKKNRDRNLIPEAEIKKMGDETGFPDRSPSSPKKTVKKIDGRSLRKTNRTEQLNLKVKVGVKEKLAILMERRDAVTMGAMVEELIDDAFD